MSIHKLTDAQIIEDYKNTLAVIRKRLGNNKESAMYLDKVIEMIDSGEPGSSLAHFVGALINFLGDTIADHARAESKTELLIEAMEKQNVKVIPFTIEGNEENGKVTNIDINTSGDLKLTCRFIDGHWLLVNNGGKWEPDQDNPELLKKENALSYDVLFLCRKLHHILDMLGSTDIAEVTTVMEHFKRQIKYILAEAKEARRYASQKKART